jgi:inactivated superfamily I helicase
VQLARPEPVEHPLAEYAVAAGPAGNFQPAGADLGEEIQRLAEEPFGLFGLAFIGQDQLHG